jgi:hypothetical protein
VLVATTTWRSNEETVMVIELYWLPLGAGGWFVRLNGRIWEAIQARLGRRRPLDLYYTALVVRVPEGRFVIENSWPIPVADGTQRGVVVQGPAFSRRLGRWRVFRYEVVRLQHSPGCRQSGPTPWPGSRPGSSWRMNSSL